MHRSGTSSLAGSLEEAGLYLGDVQTDNPWNTKGNREHLEIMHLHDAVLEASGGSWDQPPPVVKWNDSHRRRRDEIIAGYAGHDRWGFKDPRTLLTIDGWLDVLPRRELVGTFRDPIPVAESLMRRGGGDLAGWVELWVTYNTRLLDLHAHLGFPLVDFDLEPAVYQRRLSEIAEQLGLHPPTDGEAFFEPGLRHEPTGETELSGTAREVLAALREAAA